LRIAHFTDLHVTENPSKIAWRDLLSKRFLGWVNLSLRRFPVFRDAAEVTRALVRDLEQLKPDHLVSTGDLTGMSLHSEFETARDALGPLLDHPELTGIPGNHDVYVKAADHGRTYEQYFGLWTRTDLAPEDFPEAFRTLYPYPLVRFLSEDAVLLCLRDVHARAFHDSSGEVGELQLRALEHLLAEEPIARRQKILALHYGLCRADGSPDGRLHGLRDAGALISIARKAGVSLVIHGHLHGRFVLRADENFSLSIANAGSATSSHHERAYHVITVDRGRIEVAARRYDPASQRFVAWPEAPGAGVVTQ
jgi:3',5'-cyclic AMP phosphodiesterase CpdA